MTEVIQPFTPAWRNPPRIHMAVLAHVGVNSSPHGSEAQRRLTVPLILRQPK